MTNGRATPDYPTFACSSGYSVQVRRQAPGTYALLQAVAEKELAADRPPIPMQKVLIGPGQETELPMENDADYQKALRVWSRKVQVVLGGKIQKLLTSHAIITDVDHEAVANLRTALTALEADISNESDVEVWLWRIVAPTNADQVGLISFVIGEDMPSREAIQAQKAAFQSDISGA